MNSGLPTPGELNDGQLRRVTEKSTQCQLLFTLPMINVCSGGGGGTSNKMGKSLNTKG